MNRVSEIFLELVKHNTQSDDKSQTYPSTQSQLAFGDMLVEKLRAMGVSAQKDKYGYVTALIPSNIEKDVPTVAFIAHMDTSPDACGENVTPIITENYDGKEIKLKNGFLSPKEFPDLLNYKGDTIISSSGDTLLGADDKAGVAEILAFAEYAVKTPSFKRGDIKIAFTPDEEIGKGVDYFDVKAFGADFAFTMDGGKIGELEYENFNAARAVISIEGKSVHPGYAKGVMLNAGLIGAELAMLLPQNETPSASEGREGFFHLVSFEGNVSRAKLNYIIRDFDEENFENRKKNIENIVSQINAKYGDVAKADIRDEYRNMISCFKGKEYIIELTKRAFKRAGVTPLITPIRGGTDGARLSFTGLPCPNIFAGGHNFHGPYEFIPIGSMQKAVDVIKAIVEEVAEN